MKRSVGLWALWGFAVTSLLGTLLHFLYEWLDESVWVAPFSGVNESTWEHMKLLFWPMLLFSVIQSRFFKDRADFWCIKLRSILLGLLLIPVIFYTYNGVIGKSPDWINITIFFLAAAVACIYEARRMQAEGTKCCSPKGARLALALLALLFVLFTFNPLAPEIFRDPVTGKFGI